MKEERYGIVVELAEDTQASSWVHALSFGTHSHPEYGDLTFSMDRVQQFAQNVKDRVRGIDLAVNYDHLKHSGKAAGWVKDAEVRPNGLWLFVEWTKNALAKIKSREYRYMSAELATRWVHPTTKARHENVLMGAALTNTPHLKDLEPVTLREATPPWASASAPWPASPVFLPPAFDDDERLALIESAKAGDSDSRYQAILDSLVNFGDLADGKDADEIAALSGRFPGAYDRYRKGVMDDHGI